MAAAPAAAEAAAPASSDRKRPRAFTNDLAAMLFGFGGDREPDPETTDLLEEVVMEFVAELMEQAVAASHKPGRVRVEDVLFTLRKHPRFWARARELLVLKREIEEAKRRTQGEEAPPTAFEEHGRLQPGEGLAAAPGEDVELHTEDEINM